jgi:FkbM family methyltransferase
MELENTLNGGYGGLYGEVVTEDCYRLKTLGFNPDILFDFGANIGVFTRYAREMFPNAQIISVEPHLDNFVNLTTFTKSNNIVFINMAIGDGVAYRIESDVNGAHEKYVNNDADGKKVSIECIMPDKLINNYLKDGQKSYLKLDIEGNENIIWTHKESMEVLNKIDFISMELHFLVKHWNENDVENTNKMMEYFSETHNCEFIAPMFYAKKR